MGKLDFIKDELASLEASGLLRKIKDVSRLLEENRISSSHLLIDGKEVINFASNDYLGLSFPPTEEVLSYVIDFIKKDGTGGASSRLLAGNFNSLRLLEKTLADFKKTEEAMVFPSGYQTNISVISALVGAEDCIITDRLNHASLIDASRLSGAKLLVYSHCDVAELESVLKRISVKGNFRRKLIITDAIFSMDGDIAPLKELADVADKYEALLYVDEAHSTGVFGENGRGVAEYLGVEERIDIRMGTLSKALASQGGFVCVEKDMKNYLVNKCRGFIYTTAISPALAAIAIYAINMVSSSEGFIRRKNLLDAAKRLREKIKALGFDTMKSVSQIIPILVGDTQQALKLSERLFQKGIYAPAVRFPTVPKNSARLRISLTATHSEEDIDRLIDALRSF